MGLKWIHQLDHATSGVLCIGLSRRCVLGLLPPILATFSVKHDSLPTPRSLPLHTYRVAAAAGDLFARRLVTKVSYKLS